jgi:hypothetical protein
MLDRQRRRLGVQQRLGVTRYQLAELHVLRFGHAQIIMGFCQRPAHDRVPVLWPALRAVKAGEDVSHKKLIGRIWSVPVCGG